MDEENIGTEQTQPDVEVSKEMVNAMLVPEGSLEDNPVQIIPPITPEPLSTEAPITPATTEYKYNSVWEQFGEDIPEAVKTGKFEEGKTEFDYLKEEILKRNQPQAELGDIPEEAKEIIEKHKAGQYNKDEFFKQKDALNRFDSMSSEQFWKNHIANKAGGIQSEANPNGISQEKLDRIVSNKLKDEYTEIEEKELRQQYRESFNQIQIQQQTKQKEQELILQNELITKREAEFNKLFDNVKQKKEVFGVPLSEADKNTFNMEFKQALTPSETNPVVTLKVPKNFAEALKDDQIVYDLMYMIKRGTSKVKDELFKQKNNAKQNVFNALDLKPKINSGSQDNNSFQQVDVSLLTAPEQ